MSGNLLNTLLSTSTPSLPMAWVMRAGLALGWALVLATLGVGLLRRCTLRVRRVVAVAIAVCTILPAPFTPDYWLGLAFRAPSLTTMLLCAWWLRRGLTAPSEADTVTGRDWSVAGALAALVLGCVLLLDTFAVLPWQIYSAGFSAMALVLLLALSLLPWVVAGGVRGSPVVWVVPVALLLFALTRLPTGNVWDAVLDPLLWLFLLGWIVRALYRRIRASAI